MWGIIRNREVIDHRDRFESATNGHVYFKLDRHRHHYHHQLQVPLIIGIVMQLSQQLSGINAIFYYSTNIFTTSGLSEEAAKYATIGVGAVMVVMTLVSIPLMDKAGRRTLHLYGKCGLVGCYAQLLRNARRVPNDVLTVQLFIRASYQALFERCSAHVVCVRVSGRALVCLRYRAPSTLIWLHPARQRFEH